MENAPIGYEISLEQANDADLGENSRINYDLKRLDENNDGPFELMTKINGGLILKVIQNIDREERDHYEYQLIAFDNGQPKKQSSTKLFIQIDVNKEFHPTKFSLFSSLGYE
jgi:cadherin EGF LAG seven-pass G-type receptor 3